MDTSANWGEWRSLLHELEPSFEVLDRVRPRALAALAATGDTALDRVATYAEDVAPFDWGFDELVAYWQGHVVEYERIGHVRLGVPALSARERLLGEVTREDRHGLYVLMCEPFWVFVDHETDLVSQVLVNAPGAFATLDGLIAMGAAIHTLREHSEVVFTPEEVWVMEDRPGVCFGTSEESSRQDGAQSLHGNEGRIGWIAVTTLP